MKRFNIHYLCIAVVVFSFPAGSQAKQELNCTPVTSLPATISTEGIYCLTGSLTTDIISGNAITITANDVILDLNGWRLDDQGAGSGTQANGIYSTAVNVTVKNGIVRGFFHGIDLEGRAGRSAGHAA
jgi:hypothetical protein